MGMKRTVKIGIAALGILSMLAFGRRLQAQVDTPTSNAPRTQQPAPTVPPGSIPAPVLSPGYFDASGIPPKPLAKNSTVKRHVKVIARPSAEVLAQTVIPVGTAKPGASQDVVPSVVLSPGYYQVGGAQPTHVPAP